MAMLIGIEYVSAPVPARIRISRISSVAYAVDDRASEAKMASALNLLSFSSASRDDASGCPMRRRFTWRQKRPPCDRGTSTTAVARSVPSVMPRSKVRSRVRVSRAYRDPGLLP